MALALRIPLAVAALAVAGWLAVLALGAHALSELTPITFNPKPPTPAQQARGEVLVRRAERLNPDTRPELSRGVLQLHSGHPAAAERTFLAVARAEPENVDAWGIIAQTLGRYDPALAARARSRVRALAPPVPR
jgi:hypothetical protein